MACHGSPLQFFRVIRQIHRNANPSIRDKNHMVGEVEIRLSLPSLDYPLLRLAVFLTRLSARSIPHTYIERPNLLSRSCRLESRSVGWDQGRLTYSSINSRVSHRSVKERRKSRARTNLRERRQGGSTSLLSRISRDLSIREFVRARGHNGNKSSLGRERTMVSPSSRSPPSPSPFPYVVFDLGWIDDTRDAGGRRHHQRARRNVVLTSGEWEHERGKERRRQEKVDTVMESKGRKGELAKTPKGSILAWRCWSSRGAVVYRRTDFSTLRRGRLPIFANISLGCKCAFCEFFFLNERKYMFTFRRVLEADRPIIKFHGHFVLGVYHFLNRILSGCYW